jgi:hypothetical protein
MVAHTYNPSYLGGRGRKITGKSMKPYLKNKLKAKGLGVWLKG